MAAKHPEHWHFYTGPCQWYRLWHPPTWRVEDDGTTARLLSPEGECVLLLRSVWVSNWQQINLEAAADLPALFPKRKHVRRMRPLDLPYPNLGLEGKGLPASELPWWKQMFAKHPWQPWRMWIVRQKAVCLVALHLPSGAIDPELPSMIRMILNTLEFTEEPADPPQRFAERALQLAQDRFPLVESEYTGEFQLRLGESQVNLFNFYRSYLNDPGKFEEILLPAFTTVVQVQEWGQQQTEPPLESVRDRIMPMLYPASVWEEKFSNFLALPWVADLLILYVVDESQAYWYIREDLLETWGLTPQELHELALKNLDAYFETHPVECTLAGEEDEPQLLMPTRPDAYNTARLLSEGFHKQLRQVLGSELAVGLPNRDFFVAFRLDSEQTVEHIRQQVAQDYERMDHPLSPRLLLVGPDGVSEFCPP